MSSGDKIRSLYVEWTLKDNYTTQAAKVNAQVNQQKQGVEEAKYSYLTMTAAMQDSFTNAGAFFMQVDQQVREATVQQHQQTQAVAETASRFDRARTQARAYADTVRSQVARATQFINEHQAAVAATGAALSGLGYVGYRFYSEGVRDLGTYEDAYATFAKNTGDDADALIQKLQEAAAGTVTETEIVRNANKAMLMDIPVEHLPRYMEVARAAARSMGEDISYMFDSIVTGSARESPLILDNLGIKMNGLAAAEEAYASTLGKSAKALSEEERRQAFLGYVLENSDNIIQKTDLSQRSLNETVQRSSATWRDFHRELTEGAQPAIEGILDLVDGTTGALKNMPGPMKTVIGTGGLLVTAVAGITGPLLINAAAVAYLSSNYGELIFRYRTMRATAAAYAASIYTRIIPAEVAQAYATGGLSAALYAGAAAGWAFVAPWLPWIAVAGTAVAAGYLLYDLFTKGWEDSALKGTIDWLNTNVPWLTGAFEWLANVLGSVWGWITAIPDAVGTAWSSLTEHPLWQIAETVFRLTPMGIGLTAAELGANAAKDMFTQPIPAAASRSSTVVSPNITYDVRVGDIHTQKLDEAEVENIITRATKRASKQTQRDIVRQLNASIL